MIRRHAENPTRRLKLLILRMEAEDTPSCPDPLGRAPGERLWPEWFTQQMVDDARRDEFKWKTLYQQNPPSDEGSWVSPDDIQFRPSPPLTSRSVRYGMSDIALSVNTGDYTVHATVEIDPQGDWDIVEMTRERSDPDTTSTSLVNMAAVHRPVEWLIDDDNASKVFGPLVATKARQNAVSIPWRPLPMRGQDKETRAASLRGQYKRRKVFMPADAPWTSWLTRELLVFPNATGSGVDDGIDALSLLGRRMLAIARPQLTVVPKSLPTTADMTLDELFADMPNPSTARI
jgi:predicted phage terminase large subunit-like protein